MQTAARLPAEGAALSPGSPPSGTSVSQENASPARVLLSAMADGSVFQAGSAEDALTILLWKNNVEPTATPTWEMLGNGQDQSLENCLEEGFSRTSQWVLPRF